MNVVARTSYDDAGVAPGIRSLVQRLDPQVAVSEVQAMQGVISDSISPVQLMGILTMVFGGVALALSALGVYGVLALTMDVLQMPGSILTVPSLLPREITEQMPLPVTRLSKQKWRPCSAMLAWPSN